MNTLFEKVSGYPQEKLDEALEGAKVVVIPAGVPRKVIFLLFDLLCILIAFFFLAWSKKDCFMYYFYLLICLF